MKMDYLGFLEKLRGECPKLKCGRGVINAGEGRLSISYFDERESGFPEYFTSRTEAYVNFYDEKVVASFLNDKFSEPQSPDIRDLGGDNIFEEYQVENELKGACVTQGGISLVVRGLTLPDKISQYFDISYREPFDISYREPDIILEERV